MKNRLTLIAFPIIVAGTIILAAVYIAIQQSYRQAANDPQIELAEEAAAVLESGQPASAIIGGGARTDMSQSLATFVMIFDSSGRLLASSAANGTSTPFMPPAGIFASAHAGGEDRVTWQTPSGLRFAAVTVPWKAPFSISAGGASSTPSGYVVAARSLRETELREGQLGEIMLGAWPVLIIGTLLAVYFAESMIRKGSQE